MSTRTPKKGLPTAEPEQFEGLTLMRLRTENYRSVRLIDLTFDQELTTIGGDNEQGKSNYLGSLKAALGDRAEVKLDPIREGHNQGVILCDFGDGEKVQLSITCELKRVGDDKWQTEFAIEIPGYVAPSRIKEFLDKLRGELSFDPIEFDKLPDNEKFEVCRHLVGDFDFAANAAEHNRIFKQRTDVNRDRDRAYSAANSIAIGNEPPAARIDESALTQELAEVGTTERRRSNRADAARKVEAIRAEARGKLEAVEAEKAKISARLAADRASIQQQIAVLQSRLSSLDDEAVAEIGRFRDQQTKAADELTAQADALQAQLDAAEPLPVLRDVAVIQADIAAARETNRIIDAWEQQRGLKDAHQKEGDDYARQSDELSDKLTELDQQREDAIAKAHLPIDGLGFGDGFITLKGKRWGAGSQAERYLAATAIAIALNPTLHVIIIRDGSAIGSTLRGQIRDLAASKRYRVLMEIVDESGANSHVFIHGGVVATPTQASAA